MSRFVPLLPFVLGFLAMAGLVHRAFWVWLGRAFPRLRARLRVPLLSVICVLYVLPLARDFVPVHPQPHLSPWLLAAELGLLWHLGLAIGMAPIVAGWTLTAVARWRERRAASRASDAPAAAAEPDPAAARGLARRALFEQVAGSAVLGASAAVIGWGGLRGRFEWQVDEVPVRLARLPRALDGFTIVQLSDLHVGAFLGERELDRVLDGVRALKPDLIAITGDIIDFDARWIPLAARKLGELSAPGGVVCIPGNHDYYTGIGPVLSGLRRAGLDVLVNRHRLVAGGALAIVGVHDLWAPRAERGRAPDLARAVAGLDPEGPRVLLAHQPRFVRELGPHRVDLQLSGHTHGGQVNPGIAPIRLFVRYVAGLYQVDETQLYVNRGLGTAGPPTRVGAPPEITKLVLVAG